MPNYSGGARGGYRAESELLDILAQNIVLLNNELSLTEEEVIGVMKQDQKADIIIQTNKGCFALSLKTINKESFHQIDRKWIRYWEYILKSRRKFDETKIKDFLEELEAFIIENAKAREFQKQKQKQKANESIEKAERMAKKLIENKQILREMLKYAFWGNWSPNRFLLGIWERRNNNSILYIIKGPFILKTINNLTIGYQKSRTGLIYIKFTISLNNREIELARLQRKGGNGQAHKNIPKTSEKHPGNQPQFKISPEKWVEYAREKGKLHKIPLQNI